MNPLLQVENKLPAFAGVLLSLPIFNDLILKKSHQEAQSHFVKKMLYPSRPKDIPYTAEIQKRLNSRKPWKQAAQAKWKHQKNPLTNQHASRFKGIALFGEKDQTINPEHQKDILKLFPNISTHVVKGQGHGLLWTRPEEIITAITGIPKIGYHPGEESRNNVTWYLQEHLKNFPQRAALQWISPENLKNWDGNHQSSLPHESISFQDFATRIDSLAQGLLEAGIEKR